MNAICLVEQYKWVQTSCRQADRQGRLGGDCFGTHGANLGTLVKS